MKTEQLPVLPAGHAWYIGSTWVAIYGPERDRVPEVYESLALYERNPSMEVRTGTRRDALTGDAEAILVRDRLEYRLFENGDLVNHRNVLERCNEVLEDWEDRLDRETLYGWHETEEKREENG